MEHDFYDVDIQYADISLYPDDQPEIEIGINESADAIVLKRDDIVYIANKMGLIVFHDKSQIIASDD